MRCHAVSLPVATALLFAMSARVGAEEPRLRAVMRGHTDLVTCIAVSSEAKCIATASRDGKVILWNGDNRKRIRVLKTRFPHAYSVAFSPDGKSVATGGGVAEGDVYIGEAKVPEGAIQLWDVKTGKETATFRVPGGPVDFIAFSPDGRSLAETNGKKVRVWDVAQRRPRTLLTGKVVTNKEKIRMADGTVVGETSGSIAEYVAGVGWGKGIAVGTSFGHVHFWALPDNVPLSLEHGPALTSLACSPDGKTVATTSADELLSGRQGTIKLWDVANGRERATLRIIRQGTVAYFDKIAFSPDGEVVATGCFGVSDREPRWSEIDLWDLRTRKVYTSIPITLENFTSLAFSSDGKSLYVGGEDGIIRVWQLPARN